MTRRDGLLPGEWRKTKYPGDAALNLDLTKDGELGMIRIQVYGPGSYMVASYTPGEVIDNPGDTPKVEAEKAVWCEIAEEANRQFVLYCIGAFRAGWSVKKDNENHDEQAGGGRADRPYSFNLAPRG